jgi:hypothetical protein
MWGLSGRRAEGLAVPVNTQYGPQPQWMSGVYAVKAARLPELLPAVFTQLGFENFNLQPVVRLATATRTKRSSGVLSFSETRQLKIRWDIVDGRSIRIEWIALDPDQRQPAADPELMDRVQQTLDLVIARDRRSGGHEAPSETVLAPGDRHERAVHGNLRDYSECATQDDVQDFETGDLPLGFWAFQKPGRPLQLGKRLFLGRYRTGAPMIYNGVLVCAPQNTGKTSLIVRWAKAANRARYNVFVVDVKGNLRDKLTAGATRLEGDVFHLSTDPQVTDCDRINFLDGFLCGPTGLSAQATERIEQLAAAILPRDSQGRRGSEDEFHYKNSLIWLTGLIHLLLLRQVYYPRSFAEGKRRADLSDLYELARDDDELYRWIGLLREAEQVNQRKGRRLPEFGADYWVREISLLIDPEKMPEGQRDRRHSYRDYTQALVQALRPFARSGTMAGKVSDFGPGRLFRLEDLGKDEPHAPVTMILAAREQDGDKAEAVLAMTIARLQHLLFDRVRLKDPRPILLLLDETRRIRAFEPNKYITYAREAKAGCVIVYQSLDQIGEERAIHEILENVGTQIYLGSVVGNTAKYFTNVLPERSRRTLQSNPSRTERGVTRTEVVAQERVKLLTTNELFRLPAGEYPGLVYINDQPRRPPILVEMSEQARPKVRARVRVERTPKPELAGPEQVTVGAQGLQFRSIEAALGVGSVRVLVQPGVYSESLVLRRPVEIRGEGDAQQTVVEAVGAPAVVVSGAEVTLKKLTLRANGVAVVVAGGKLLLEDCQIESAAGAGIEIRAGEGDFRRVAVYECGGPGVLVEPGARVVVSYSDLAGNSAPQILVRGTAAVEASYVRFGKDCGVCVEPSGKLSLTDSSVVRNARNGVEVKSRAGIELNRVRFVNNGEFGVLGLAGSTGQVIACRFEESTGPLRSKGDIGLQPGSLIRVSAERSRS